MSVQVRSVPTADEQIEAADVWWRGNRPSAPNLFAEEFRAAKELLSRSPEVGRRRRHPRVPGLRRMLLPRTLVHVCYTYDPRHEVVIVLAVWSTVRGRGPRLELPEEPIH